MPRNSEQRNEEKTDNKRVASRDVGKTINKSKGEGGAIL